MIKSHYYKSPAKVKPALSLSIVSSKTFLAKCGLVSNFVFKTLNVVYLTEAIITTFEFGGNHFVHQHTEKPNVGEFMMGDF